MIINLADLERVLNIIALFCLLLILSSFFYIPKRLSGHILFLGLTILFVSLSAYLTITLIKLMNTGIDERGLLLYMAALFIINPAGLVNILFICKTANSAMHNIPVGYKTKIAATLIIVSHLLIFSAWQKIPDLLE